jgi:hypothetical protein
MNVEIEGGHSGDSADRSVANQGRQQIRSPCREDGAQLLVVIKKTKSLVNPFGRAQQEAITQ